MQNLKAMTSGDFVGWGGKDEDLAWSNAAVIVEHHPLF